MEVNEILDRLDNAITQLLENEKEILTRGLNELNLNGHLTKYLTPLFEGFVVDPEYNGDKLKPSDRKALDIAKSRLVEIGIKPNNTDNYKLTPDIIIHTRNVSENNLVVIEIKKDSNSKQNRDFDLIKLEHLTIDYLGNHYNYKLGVALILGTKENAGRHDVKYFQNGIMTERNSLR